MIIIIIIISISIIIIIIVIIVIFIVIVIIIATIIVIVIIIIIIIVIIIITIIGYLSSRCETLYSARQREKFPNDFTTDIYIQDERDFVIFELQMSFKRIPNLGTGPIIFLARYWTCPNGKIATPNSRNFAFWSIAVWTFLECWWAINHYCVIA